MGLFGRLQANKQTCQEDGAEEQGTAHEDIKNAIRWNIGQLEHDTIGTDSVQRPIVIGILRLNRISPHADPSGDNTFQQLIAEGWGAAPEAYRRRAVFRPRRPD